MAGARPSAAQTSVPPSVPLNPTQGDRQRPENWDSWYPNLDQRPDLSMFAKYNLSPDDMVDIQTFFKRRSAYLDMELHPTVHCPTEIRTNAALYRNELELIDNNSNSRVRVLGKILSDLDTNQINYMRGFFSEQPNIEEAEKMYASIVRDGRPGPESLNEVLSSGAFPHSQRALEIVAETVARTGGGGKLWNTFRNQVPLARLYLTSFGQRAKDAEEDALLKWWEILDIRRR